MSRCAPERVEPGPSARPRQLPGWFARWGLNAIVAMHAVSLAILVFLLFSGTAGAHLAPLALGAVAALFLLACIYARWLFSGLRWRFILAIVVIKELGVLALFGLILGAAVLLRWLT